MDQDVSEFTNIFHTLRTKLGIKVLSGIWYSYRSCLRKYIQDEMDFLDIFSVGVAYQYVVKIEHKFKQKKWDFGSVNPKQDKGAPKLQNKGQSQDEVT